MKGSIELSPAERRTLSKVYRSGDDVRVARRAHVLLLLADGITWEQIRRLLRASNDLIAGVRRRFLDGGVAAVLGEKPEGPEQGLPEWLEAIRCWISEHTPQEFGYFRTRWSCALLAEMLAWQIGVRRSGEAIRRRLHQLGFVWRRPRPVVGPADPQHAQKLREIRRLLKRMPAGEVAVFQDEVDVHLNPKIGAMWMLRGQQAEVVTPGNNRKCHVSGSLVWNTGTLLVSQPEAHRNTDLFLDHLDDLRRHLRCWKRIHVICDNASFHNSRRVREYLEEWGHRIALHFLPRYSPQTNPIERVWWHLHETITRNHRCGSLTELVQRAFAWFRTHDNYYLDMRHTFNNAT